MEKELIAETLQEAARWYARLRAPDCNAAERRAFHAWLVADETHQRAYERSMRAALRVETALGSQTRWQALAAQALAEGAANSSPRRFSARALLRPALVGAFTVVLAVLVGLFAEERHSRQAEVLYANHSDTRSQVRLEDGSLLNLDVGAEVAVKLEKHARQLRLKAGRAYFTVAHDSTRPFTVDAAGTRTTALGTEFEVSMREDRVTVTLAKGSVSVAATEAGRSWTGRLAPGQQVSIEHGESQPVAREVDLNSVIGWSYGLLQFKGTLLRDAVAEWNRYAKVAISLSDETLGDMQIGGSFRAGGDSSEFVSALVAVLPVHAVQVGAEEILVVRDYTEPPF